MNPSFNPSSPSINMHVLHTVFHIFQHGTSWENLLTHQDTSSFAIIYLILMTCMFDQVMIPAGEITCRCLSLLGTKGLTPLDFLFGTQPRNPRGVLKVYMTGGSDVFFWVENLHARYFFGSRDLSRVFFWVLSPSELFVSGFRCDQWIRRIFTRTFFQRRVSRVLVFFGLEILMPGIFWV